MKISLLLSLACLLAAPPQDGPDLRWHFTKGDTFRHEICIVTSVSVGETVAVTVNGTGVAFEVLDVDNQGSATLSVLYDRQLYAKAGARYDSDCDKATDAPSQFMRGLLGKPFRLRVGRTGEILSVDGFAAMRRKAVESMDEDNRADQVMEDAAADELATTNFAHSFFGLPGRKAAAWDGALPPPAPILNGMTITTRTSAAYALPDGRRHLLVQSLKGTRPAVGNFSDLTLKGKAWAAWDAKTGRVLRTHRVQSIDGKMGSDPVSIRMEFHAREVARADEAARKRLATAIESVRTSSYEVPAEARSEIAVAGDAALMSLLPLHDSENARYFAQDILAGEPLAKTPLPDERLGGRQLLVARGGGKRESEAAVLAGLRWLVRHQAEDGSWGGGERCGRTKAFGGTCDGWGKRDPVRDTALALLALSGSGYSSYSRDAYDGLKMGDAFARGVDWLLSKQDDKGRFATDTAAHALATLAIADEIVPLPAESLRTAGLFRAVRALEASHVEGKGWSDAESTSWALWALWTAKQKGMAVSERVLSDAKAWLLTQDAGPSGAFAALLHGATAEDDLVKRSLEIGEKPDVAAWHAAALVLFQVDGPPGERWKAWNRAMLTTLAKPEAQEKKCESGSWDAATVGGGGRTAATAFAVMTLESYYRYPKLQPPKK